jgi:hypothetical protein
MEVLASFASGHREHAMYDNGTKEDRSEFKRTEYWGAVQNFQKFWRAAVVSYMKQY